MKTFYCILPLNDFFRCSQQRDRGSEIEWKNERRKIVQNEFSTNKKEVLFYELRLCNFRHTSFVHPQLDRSLHGQLEFHSVQLCE